MSQSFTCSEWAVDAGNSDEGNTIDKGRVSVQSVSPNATIFFS